MKRGLQLAILFFAVSSMAVTCKKQAVANTSLPEDTMLVNTSHLDYLYTPFTFSTGANVAGIYIYSEAPDYHLVPDADEGFTCVDDVARAMQVYVRNAKFLSDTSMQNKAYNLINFLLEMQSDNGYFFNFVFPDYTINTSGQTSTNNANWWSWRALYALSESSPVIRNKNPQLANKMDVAINAVVAKIKTDFFSLPETTKVVSGITVPQWLPAGSGTDQAAILLLGLLPLAKNDAAITSYTKKLTDGIALMQYGDAAHFPYACILSWENTWHAYAGDQAYALMKAGEFFNDTSYTNKCIAEVKNFYPWLLQNGMKSNIEMQSDGTQLSISSQQSFDQIAYAIRPIVTAAAEAYHLTGENKYADIAGHLAAWFLGANNAGTIMYSISTGICFDGIRSATSVNKNSGAESTIEALLTMEIAEANPAIKTAMYKYKK
ncbi:MAG TPA: hypothetical protein VEV62_12400 [Parafilimonas sp.]|nr:hypothetical protein [Parafilimonas sp.]